MVRQRARPGRRALPDPGDGRRAQLQHRARADELPLLETERVPLETVLRNLLGNAVKHHNRSGGVIRVSAADQGDWVEFSVAVQEAYLGQEDSFHV